MKRVRSVLFWCHLTAGVTASLIILIMCITGALLAFEPQILALRERHVRWVPAADSNAARIGVTAMLTSASRVKRNARPTALLLDADRRAAAAVSFGRDAPVFVNPYTSAVLGEGSPRTRAAFQTLTDWHRWLGADNSSRGTARAVTGACNFAFLGLAVSGLYLWWPRKWTRNHVRAFTAFDGRARGKARDFNWHNVIGFWCAPVLILTSTAVVMSYPWANQLLYRVTGSPLPQPGGQGGGANASREDGRAQSERGQRGDLRLPSNLDLIWARAEDTLPTWASITMRLAPRPGAPVSFTITDGAYWNAFARSQLTIDSTSGEIVRREPYSKTSAGQKARGWVRFGHTGELGRWPGQLIAGVACVGGGVLVWTGLALAFRRLVGWRLWKRLSKAGTSQPLHDRRSRAPAMAAAAIDATQMSATRHER